MTIGHHKPEGDHASVLYEKVDTPTLALVLAIGCTDTKSCKRSLCRISETSTGAYPVSDGHDACRPAHCKEDNRAG